MTTQTNGGPAFPQNSIDQLECHAPAQGMTLRDYFAGQAIQSIRWTNFDGGFDEAARAAYLFADAMLKAREK